MSTPTPRDVINAFLNEVRSAKHPERAGRYMADEVAAHQVQSEAPTVVMRTPADYANHVREMWAANGPFTLTIEDMICEGERVYVRWRQQGWSNAPDQPRRALIEVASAVYHVQAGRIVRYHIQIDRKGLELQMTSGAD
ncbi:MAG: ester cyclase [Burkholderiales bacterium]|nr:ester cyclase [Burkholderiales bacterium]